MADTPPAGETAKPGDSQTQGTPPAAPATPAPANVDNAEVERLRREKEQAEMRARQLENEKRDRDATDAEAKRKQLEEQDEYKQLYEKTQADLKALQDTQAAAERNTALSQATDGIFKDYPTEVVELAKTAGLGLSDDSDASQTALKEKLDAFKARIAPGSTAPVASSNPGSSAPAPQGQQPQGLGHPRSLGEDNGSVKISETNREKLGEYIRGIPAIERMKQDAGIRPRT